MGILPQLLSEMPQIKAHYVHTIERFGHVTALGEARHQSTVMCEIPVVLGWNARFGPNWRLLGAPLFWLSLAKCVGY